MLPVYILQVYVVVGIAAVAFTGFLLMLVILKFGGNSKFNIKGKNGNFDIKPAEPPFVPFYFYLYFKVYMKRNMERQ